MAFAPKTSKPRLPGIITQAEKPRTTQKTEPPTRLRRAPSVSVSEGVPMRNTRPKSVEASVGAEMGTRRVAKPEAPPKRTKPRSPVRKPVATRPVVESARPKTLGSIKKKSVTAIRNDPAPKVPTPSRYHPQLTSEQPKAEPIVVAPDVLSLSAQLAPWIYMSSTLGAALQGSETRLKVRKIPPSTVVCTNDTTHQQTLEERNRELGKEETRFEDARIRATKAAQIGILEELGFGEVCREAISTRNIS